MTVKQIHELTAATDLVGADLFLLQKATGNLTRKMSFSDAAPYLRVILEINVADDNSPFTDGTSSVSVVGFIFDEVAGAALTENDQGAARMDAKRAQINAIEDATTRGQRLAVTAQGEAKVLSATVPAVSSATQFTRPADTTTYASGDIVANSTTAGSVAALTFTSAARISAGALQVRRARIRKSTTTTSNASFRLHLFKEAPTTASGDNGAFTGVTNTNDSYIGAVDVTIDRVFASGSVGYGAPTVGNELNVKLASGSSIYGLLEATAAYAPGNAETFDVSLEVVQF